MKTRLSTTIAFVLSTLSLVACTAPAPDEPSTTDDAPLTAVDTDDFLAGYKAGGKTLCFGWEHQHTGDGQLRFSELKFSECNDPRDPKYHFRLVKSAALGSSARLSSDIRGGLLQAGYVQVPLDVSPRTPGKSPWLRCTGDVITVTTNRADACKLAVVEAQGEVGIVALTPLASPVTRPDGTAITYEATRFLRPKGDRMEIGAAGSSFWFDKVSLAPADQGVSDGSIATRITTEGGLCVRRDATGGIAAKTCTSGGRVTADEKWYVAIARQDGLEAVLSVQAPDGKRLGVRDGGLRMSGPTYGPKDYEWIGTQLVVLADSRSLFGTLRPIAFGWDPGRVRLETTAEGRIGTTTANGTLFRFEPVD